MQGGIRLTRNIFMLALLVWLPGAGRAQSLTDQLNAYLQAAHAAGFQGTVLVARHGQVILNRGYGWRNAEARQPNDSASIFQLGSLTKQFTAAAVLMLQEQGKLSIHDAVSKFLPEFPEGSKITLEQLLTHTSGIHNYTEDAAFMKERSHAPVTEDEMIRLIGSFPLDFPPGTAYHYSNSGYSLLGYIIQRAGGTSYEAFIRRHILEPLGMTHSGFNFTELADAHKAIGYASQAGNTVERAAIVDSSVSFSAGALYATVGDFYRWNMSLINGSLLQAESRRNMFTPRKSNYALGLGVLSLNGQRVITHDGGIDGFATHNLIIPDDSTVITVFSNVPAYSPGRVGQDILKILQQKPVDLPKARTEVEVPEAILQKYVGVYQMAPDFDITITLEKGRLKAQATRQPAFDLFAEKENLFYLTAVSASIEFVANENGEVNQLILHQNGRDSAAFRKKK